MQQLLFGRAGALAMAAGVSLMLAACGGGGDAAPATGDQAVQPAPGATPDCGLADFPATALTLINAQRAAGADCRSAGQFGPAAALRWNDLLAQAAAGHSSDMAENDYFSHTSRDGRTLAERIDATGYEWTSAGENIAAGYGSVEAVMAGWMASDGHCANIMKPQFTEMGMACVPGSASTTYTSYWTLNLAKP